MITSKQMSQISDGWTSEETYSDSNARFAGRRVLLLLHEGPAVATVKGGELCCCFFGAEVSPATALAAVPAALYMVHETPGEEVTVASCPPGCWREEDSAGVAATYEDNGDHEDACMRALASSHPRSSVRYSSGSKPSVRWLIVRYGLRRRGIGLPLPPLWASFEGLGILMKK